MVSRSLTNITAIAMAALLLVALSGAIATSSAFASEAGGASLASVSGDRVLATQASKAKTNKKAHKLYKKQVKKLASKSISGEVEYSRYVDITGDGVHELLAEIHPSNTGSGRYFYIYTYKSGKLKRLLRTSEYGLQKLKAYGKGKGIVLHGGGHGGEWYMCFAKKSGKYACIATKSRTSTKYGGFENGPWGYYGGNSYDDISKAEFKSMVKPYTKGKAKAVAIR